MDKIKLIEAILDCKGSGTEEKWTSSKESLKIVILQRGWVFIGYLSKSGSDCTLKKASNIRRWGTTAGLGQLAMDGPTGDTKLDKCPDVNFHELTIIATIDCLESKWKNVLI